MKYLSRVTGFITLGAFLLTSLLAQTPGPGPVPMLTPEAAAPAEELIGPINLPGDTVDAFLQRMEVWTGKAILRPQNLPEASITLILKDKVTKREAIQAVETLLNMNGIALTPLGTRFLKATPLNQAKSEAPEFIEGSTLALTPSGRTVSKLFQLNFLRIGEFMPQISGLMNPAAGSPPVIFEKANSALITDSLSNLQRIETLVTQLDQPMLSGLQSKFFQVHNVKASDLVNKLRALFTGPLQAQLGTATTFNADDRTNQIILLSDPRQHSVFEDLINKLDIKSESNNRNEVIPLKHAAAKDVQSVLSSLVTGQTTAAKASGQENINRPGLPPMPQNTGGPMPMPSPQMSLASLGVSTEGSNQFSSGITIIADERTNAIVVSGNLDDIRLIKTLVDKLDIILAQVRIEVIIAEVTLSDGATSGIDSLGLRVEGGKLTGIVGSTSGLSVGGTPASSVSTGNTTSSPDYATSLFGKLNAILKVSTTPRKGNTTILSRPTITTTHNKEAKIFVGETRPTITGSTTSNASVGATTPYTTSNITQQEVGITVTVKPLIGNDGSVQMDLKQEISDVGDPVTIDGNVQNIILKRTTSQFITATSGEILVLAGLQKKSNTKSTSRLGPIPILGDLLGTRSRSESRTELIFFMRPFVLTNTPADNEPAFKDLEKLPRKDREEVKKALGAQPAS